MDRTRVAHLFCPARLWDRSMSETEMTTVEHLLVPVDRASRPGRLTNAECGEPSLSFCLTVLARNVLDPIPLLKAVLTVFVFVCLFTGSHRFWNMSVMAIFRQPATCQNYSSRLAAAEPLFKFGLIGFLTAIPASSASSGPAAKSPSSSLVETPVLSKILLRWCFTVSSLILKYSAISLLEKPPTTAETISSSRGVRPNFSGALPRGSTA